MVIAIKFENRELRAEALNLLGKWNKEFSSLFVLHISDYRYEGL